MQKSTCHNMITCDFAESLVLYWLSKNEYECARVDHTGIDLIACKKDGSERMSISAVQRSLTALSCAIFSVGDAGRGREPTSMQKVVRKDA